MFVRNQVLMFKYPIKNKIFFDTQKNIESYICGQYVKEVNNCSVIMLHKISIFM